MILMELRPSIDWAQNLLEILFHVFDYQKYLLQLAQIYLAVSTYLLFEPINAVQILYLLTILAFAVAWLIEEKLWSVDAWRFDIK